MVWLGFVAAAFLWLNYEENVNLTRPPTRGVLDLDPIAWFFLSFTPKHVKIAVLGPMILGN
jgi:hypothetical protein